MSSRSSSSRSRNRKRHFTATADSTPDANESPPASEEQVEPAQVPLEADAAAEANQEGPAYLRQSKATVWAAHPREDSYGCLLMAHIDGLPLDADSLASTPLDRLRFLLVQRRSTGAWTNVMQDLQESPRISSGAKESWWVTREANRFTDLELDALNGPFDTLWADETRVSVNWKVAFADANETFARAKYPALQKVCDQIRAQRVRQGRFEPDDDHNLSKLNFVLPKGQLQTASSIQRLPHILNQEVDASIHAGAVREVVEETNITASDFEIAPAEVAPLTFCKYPPRKVDIFLAFLRASSSVHPSRVTRWQLEPQAETRVCAWMSLAEVMAYFAQARIYPQTYTASIFATAMRRFGWEAPLAAMQAEAAQTAQQQQVDAQANYTTTKLPLTPRPSLPLPPLPPPHDQATQ